MDIKQSKHIQQKSTDLENKKTNLNSSPDVKVFEKSEKSLVTKPFNGKKLVATPIDRIASVPQWVFLKCKQTDVNGNPMVLNVQGKQAVSGTQCITWPYQSNAENEMFQLTMDGRIISQLGQNLVVGLGDQLDWGGFECVIDTYNNSLSQFWNANLVDSQDITAGFYLTNGNNQFGLGLDGGQISPVQPANSTKVIVAPGNNNLSYVWQMVPSLPLNFVIMQPAVAFPAYDQGDDLQTSYQDMCSACGVPDLRQEYSNLSVSLISYQSIINQMQVPGNVSNAADFYQVRNQLNKELTYCQSVINLFSNYEGFHNSLFIDKGFRLQSLCTLAGIEQQSELSLGICILNFFSGLVYTVLSAMSSETPFLGILANLINTAVSIGVAAESSENSISPDPFQLQISKLWETLSDNFVYLLGNVENMEATILQDWGMLQAVNKLILLPVDDPNSLNWQPTFDSQFISSSQNGYDISVLQMLLPSKYTIYTVLGFAGGAGGIPDSCYLQEELSDGSYNLYYIADRDDNSKFPSDDLMNKLWIDLSVSKDDFFKNNNGWSFAVATQPSYYDCVVSVTNSTQNPLSFTVDVGSGPGTIYNTTPYNSTMCNVYGFWPANTDFVLNVTDDTNNREVGYFVCKLRTKLDKGSYVEMDSYQLKKGYMLLGPNFNEGSWAGSYTASIQFTILLDPNV
ncbi:calcium up-regulated protein [Heterostelium album PN500]|uniref:Calcium up-regulated protein n=1 Tax=Heterostelium pallidum (strain ATCC 26659 / Pp 5 / PN500) TaxID=670386 RepID=D3BDC9_HETP5|nr:calcium up-regulated protein [Heterostelium album PN500]EFA80573.1 calcium up-regulated protein [Heterostelium album PN500]|eukprot:XP_020432693.1 calcium up-regulated protein [Heterostelium album PN500]